MDILVDEAPSFAPSTGIGAVAAVRHLDQPLALPFAGRTGDEGRAIIWWQTGPLDRST